MALLLIVLGHLNVAQAQEENLNMALEMQDRRVAGLKRLAEQIKSFGFLSKGKEVVTKIEERERKQDPFGMAMDPEQALPEITPEITSEVVEEAPKTTLQEALSKFHVTGIFPREQQVMVGAQNLGVGSDVVIDYKGVQFNLKIEKISSHEIVMKDMDTGEVASVPLGFDGNLPEGMSRRRPAPTTEDESRQAETIVPMTGGVVKVD
ncbi:MAG: hypothetical protein KDN19_07265 [Verrucomicrobiae bacterium]|nr:hypothetical protein [Verrucomicrobiae bacterium]